MVFDFINVISSGKRWRKTKGIYRVGKFLSDKNELCLVKDNIISFDTDPPTRLSTCFSYEIKFEFPEAHC